MKYVSTGISCPICRIGIIVVNEDDDYADPLYQCPECLSEFSEKEFEEIKAGKFQIENID